jgi:hypothetical protein
MITLSFPLGGEGDGGRGGRGGRTDVRWEVTRLNAGDFKTYASILLKKLSGVSAFKENSLRYIYKKN